MTDNDETLSTLKRIEESLSILVRCQLAPTLRPELVDPKMAKVYNLTGNKNSKIIAKEASCSESTVSSSWKRWEQLGLLIKDGKSYRKVLP